uniref:Protein FAM98A n=1 Tax=Phallusia mammillata TaxID=59560 RepID=A0A6F9DBU7_9ASCI|nr:hypothetical protein cihA9G14 uncharacterized protein LOC494405 [Phallusia mammillata]
MEVSVPNSFVTDILDNLEDLGYPKEFDEETIIQMCQQGLNSVTFTQLVSFLTSELRLFYNITENVNAIEDTSNTESFLFELSGFLAEYGCPYSSLTAGSVTQRLQTAFDCATLIVYLSSELQAAKMYFYHHPSVVTNHTEPINSESENMFQSLKSICVALKMTRPPDDILLPRFFTGLLNKISECIKQPSVNLSSPIIKQQLGPLHFEKLHAVNAALCREYGTRRTMLLKRLDVTIASFNWSDKAKKNVNDIAESYQKRRHALTAKPNVTVATLLAARDDLSQMCKTSSGSTRHQCAINKVMIGKVPDRGGRPNESEPPPPEMPSWQKRQDDGGSRGRRGGHRGGRGNYQQHNNYSHGGGSGKGDQQSRPSSGRGYHSQGRGGGQSRWGRGRGGGHNAAAGGGGSGGGSFDQFFGRGGQTFNNDGFRGGQVYTS